MGQNKVASSELGRQVRDKLADKPGKTIFVRADARAQYRAVEDAIDAVRTAGVDEVGLLTQKKEGGLLGRPVRRGPGVVSLTILQESRSLKPWHFQLGGGGGQSSDINVTPMIDILLVLLDHLHGHCAGGAARAWMRWCPSRPRIRSSSSSPMTAPSWCRCSISPAQSPTYKINETEVCKGRPAGAAD